MTNPSNKKLTWNEYFIAMAQTTKIKSTCLKRQVGAVIVLHNRVISGGYNGTPSGTPNCGDGGCYRCKRSDLYKPGEGYAECLCVHAETNAIIMAARFGIAIAGGDIYSTLQPCITCLNMILQAQLSNVFYATPWIPPEKFKKQYVIQQTFLKGKMVQTDIRF